MSTTEKLAGLIRKYADTNSRYPLSPRDLDAMNARAEGLAFEIEGAFIVIPRADLPEVGDPPGRIESSAADLRHQGLRFLALAEYLAAHPPVDEAEVEALAEALAGGEYAVVGGQVAVRNLARRLVAAGWKR